MEEGQAESWTRWRKGRQRDGGRAEGWRKGRWRDGGREGSGVEEGQADGWRKGRQRKGRQRDGGRAGRGIEEGQRDGERASRAETCTTKADRLSSLLSRPHQGFGTSQAWLKVKVRN